MKTKNNCLLGIFAAICLSGYSLSCNGQAKIEGTWLEPIPGMENRLQGFKLEDNGKASSVNMATLLYDSWKPSYTFRKKHRQRHNLRVYRHARRGQPDGRQPYIEKRRNDVEICPQRRTESKEKHTYDKTDASQAQQFHNQGNIDICARDAFVHTRGRGLLDYGQIRKTGRRIRQIDRRREKRNSCTCRT